MNKSSNKFVLDKSSLEFFLAAQSSKYNKIVYFSSIEYDFDDIKNKLIKINPKLNVIEFPSFDCLFFSNLSPTNKNKSDRINCLHNLVFSDFSDNIIISSLKAITTNTINIETVKKFQLVIRNRCSLTYDRILNFLVEGGYERVDFVHNKGEFAIRGEIMDIFSPIHKQPLRILFDFEKINKLNLFSTQDQLSISTVNDYYLSLSSEFQFNSENIECFRSLFRKLKLKDKDDYYKSLSQKIVLPGSEQFFPILNNSFNSFLEYLDGYKIFLDANFEKDFKQVTLDSFDNVDEYKELNKIGCNYFYNLKELNSKIENRFNTLSFNLLNTNVEGINYFSSRYSFYKNKILNQKQLMTLIKKREIIIFCYSSNVNKKKILSFLNSQNINYIDNFKQDFFDLTTINFKFLVYKLTINNSFVLNFNNTHSLYFIADEEIYGKTSKKYISKSIKEENLIDDYSNLKIGDYIVHNDHGIGKYNGLISRTFNNVVQEFLELLYQGNDKLLIPVENLDQISKYGQSEIKVSLDKLGVQSWQQRRAIVKNRIKDIAENLLKTAAKRKLEKGDVLIPKSFEYEKFSSEFEFTETSDQLKSIQQIENDLASGTPMDRLICGDVGFGKTEIAMRASFISVSAGFQVALICPKLLLVNQHIKNFKKRFKNFDYVIKKISRIESDTEKKNLKEEIENGNIDILIGTHAILSSELVFKKLGLIIIDEEQSFGVEQKEILKKFKPNCHILTLTATPIPRTLQSSIFQLKNISLIKTPPLSRLNIKTYLMLKEKKQIKKIIQKEINRDGQIFYVAPRISDLNNIQKNLNNLIPNEKIEVIHGRLSNKNVEESYNRFFLKKSKILVSTAMIESGLDISNVNTIIIEKPQLFGLSQLYQLRGRVGRSSRQAYAYLLLDDFKNISENSIQKLKIISKIQNLGAGLSIASSDLDLRGGGNIVGSEQSGHIKEVGIELYYKMLKETIDELKNIKTTDRDWSPVIKLGFAISIPKNYIKDLDMRLRFYRKISNIVNIDELKDMLSNLNDRFGNIPKSLKNLFHIIEIKIKAKKMNIKKIENTNKGFVLEFKDDNMMNVEKLIKLVEKNAEILKLMPGSKLFFKNVKIKDEEKVMSLKNFLQILSKQI